MKKLFITIILGLAGFVPAAFAGNDPQPGQVVQEEFDKVTFLLAGSRAVAYFNAQGELAGSVRDLFFNQLPLSVMTAVDKRFPEAVIYDVHEISNDNGTSYRITLEEKSKKKVVRLDSAGRISDVEKL
jgi:hypothetical protein